MSEPPSREDVERISAGLQEEVAGVDDPALELRAVEADNSRAHLRGRPATKTVSTLRASAPRTTLPYALLSGIEFTSSARITAMSASLPGVSVPVLCASQFALAPWTVAKSSTSRTPIRSGAAGSPS